MIGDAGVAGRGIEFFDAGRLRQLPAQGMFASARTQQQDVHTANAPGRPK
jgi:hypothetical protein